MGVYLVTGQPGHGKTAYAIDKAFAFQKEGRAIYAHGIKDFDYERAKWTHLEDPKLWEQLPDGSVILLDECYTVFPNRNPGSKVPDHVEAMARHRHRGFDFILIAQQGLQLDPFLRGLYEEHCHVRQTSVIKSKTKLKKWDAYQGNVGGPCGNVVDWVRPKYVFDYYTSTTLVTTKRTIPRWMWTVMAGLCFVLLCLVYLKHSYTKKINDMSAHPVAADQSGTAVTGASAKGAAVPPPPKTPTEYAKEHLPRFASMPWTAPVYDQRQVTVDPQLLCMSSSAGLDANGKHVDGGCHCVTEQNTVYEMNEAECRRVARVGPPYNPYRQTQPVAPVAPVAAIAPPQGYQGSPGAIVGAGKAIHGAGLPGAGADQFARAPGYPTNAGFTSF